MSWWDDLSGFFKDNSGLIGAGATVAGALIGSNAAGNAADVQANAANNAAQLQSNAANNALAFQKQVYADQQRNLAPFLATGTSANVNLARLMGVLPQGASLTGAQPAPKLMQRAATTMTEDTSGGPYNPNTAGGGSQIYWTGNVAQPLDQLGNSGIDPQFVANQIPTPAAGGQPAPSQLDMSSLINPSLGAEGSLAQGWQGGDFKAPTDVTEQNDPGYQFRLAQGQKAIEQSAAARGGLLSGGTAKALNDYSQGQASNEYGNVYQRALGEYQQRYNQFQQGGTNLFNRLQALSGGGQVTAGELNSAGNAAAGNNTNILLGSAGQIGNNINNAGYQRGSGYAAQGNIWNTTLQNLAQLATLSGNKPATATNGANTADPVWLG